MIRHRWYEALALSVAAAASLATSQPPPDWTQEAETEPQVVALRAGEMSSMSLYVERPTSLLFYLRLASRAPLALTITTVPDTSSEPCRTKELYASEWRLPKARAEGETPLYLHDVSLPDSCFPNSRGLVHVTFELREAAPPSDVQAAELEVKASASASGDDDEPQEPRLKLEQR
jgi:hypothetical protein